MLIGGKCGYATILDNGILECQQMGLRLTVYDALSLGGFRSIVRCIEHSDWIEADRPPVKEQP